VAGLVPATHVFVANCGYIKTWMPGPSPGKGRLAAKFGSKRGNSRAGNGRRMNRS